MAGRLLAHRKPGIDAVVWRTRDGRIQPMCAFYSRTCVNALKQCIDMRHYRITAFLDRINCMGYVRGAYSRFLVHECGYA